MQFQEFAIHLMASITLSRRLWLLAPVVLALGFTTSHAQETPAVIPAGTKLVVADQNESLQTLLKASGVHAGFQATVTYANFLGGPAIFEAFRAGALDLALVGNTPPIQAHAAGDILPIVAVRKSSVPDYNLAVRPGLQINSLKELKGKKIAYAEGSGRQPFVLAALKQAGLTRKDVQLIPLRVADFPTAIRTGQVDVAALNEPHFSRYLRDFAVQKASALPDADHALLPTNTLYLYASQAALKNPAKRAAIAQVVQGWAKAGAWQQKHPQEWARAYYVKNQRFSEAEALALVKAEGVISNPLLVDSIADHQKTIDLIVDAGDLPKRLNARDEFDLSFDAVIRQAQQTLQSPQLARN